MIKTPTGKAPIVIGTIIGPNISSGDINIFSSEISGNALSSNPRPSKKLPVLNVDNLIKGKVNGLPTHVPIAEARILPPKNQASNAAVAKCVPINGEADTPAPIASPRAIL